MDLLKNLVVIAVLAVIAGGVYIVLTGNVQPKPPAGAETWTGQAPTIEIPQIPSTPGIPATTPPVGSGPLANTAASEAPRFQPNPSPGATREGGEAPRFQPTPPPGAIQGSSAGPRFQLNPPAPPDGNETSRSVPPLSDASNLAASHTAPMETQPSKIPLRSDSMQFAPPASPAPGTSEIRGEFAAFIDAAIKKLNEGGLAEAHERLSLFYANPRLTPEEDQRLTELLDQVAGTLIYSRQHHLEPPHVVQPGETLQQIGEKYHVPWQLLAKINCVRDPEHLAPGQELKVVRGPFNAVIHLRRYEMALMLQGRYYAGRFPIGIGQDQPIMENSSFTVKDKMINPTYYGNGQVIDADNPNNPLGERLIGLGNRISIHGTNDPQGIGRSGGPGTIRLSNRDAEDVYDILSIGSRVVIQR